MSDSAAQFLASVVIFIVVIALNVWMTKAGAPQQVWIFCDQFGWCK